MYAQTIDAITSIATQKTALLRKNPAGFFLSAMMAGAYVGLGILLIFSLGADLDPTYRKLVMGASFGIALTLVVFAGSDLFTGHTMYMSLARLQRRAGWTDLAGVWSASWLGNFAGSVLLAVLFVLGGGGNLLFGKSTLLYDVATAKMTAAPLSLFARAILCNWLVCLALWMSARMTSETAKAIAIFWCLFAFIASGYEHSVANMTLLTLALLGNHPETVSIAGLANNLVWVTLGNIVGGAIFMAGAYWYVSRPVEQTAVAATALVASRAAD